MVDITLLDASKRIREWAATKRDIAAVYIFGSRVRGGARADSDFDIAIEFINPDADGAFADFIFESETWRQELQRLLPWPVDLDLYHRETAPNVWGYVQDSGVQIY